jgi:hypothetical protein
MAERYLCAAALNADPDTVLAVRPLLSRSEFAGWDCGLIWEAAVAASRRAVAPSVPVVADILCHWGKLDEIGAEPFLVEIAGYFCLPWLPWMNGYAGVVAEWAARRAELAALGDRAKVVMSGLKPELWHEQYQNEV